MAGRAGAYSRGLASVERLLIWRTNRRRIAFASVGYVFTSASLVFAASMAFRRELAWFVAGLAVAAFGPLVRAIFMTHEYRRLSESELAEEFTSSELRSLRWCGWKTIDRVQFDRYDVDHVAIGPGGVCVIETKNTNVSWPVEAGHFSDAWASMP